MPSRSIQVELYTVIVIHDGGGACYYNNITNLEYAIKRELGRVYSHDTGV